MVLILQPEKGISFMAKIQLFLQFEGERRIELIELDSDALGSEIIQAALRAGLDAAHAHGTHVFGPDDDSPLKPDVPLDKQGIRHKHRVHVHRCRRVEVKVHFNECTELLEFPPSATVDRVKKQFVKAIEMSPVDASEHVLQLCGTTERPEPDTQIGTLVCGCCSVCFDLVPIKRVEG